MIENDMNYTGIEAAIQNRLETGFANWNGGFDAWKKWCEELYLPDAYYNVYGHRMTLGQYEGMMQRLFQKYTMHLNDFQNMIIRGSWCAIRYTVTIEDLATGEQIHQNTMEFVKFAEVEGPEKVRVVEGWALSDSPLSPR